MNTDRLRDLAEAVQIILHRFQLNIELPDGYLFFAPIINWGKYRQENDRLVMPVTVRLNHAIADGYLVANVFRLLEREISAFCSY